MSVTRTDVYCETNLTPVAYDNGPGGDPRYTQEFPCSAYMQNMGARPVHLIYDGTINRAPTWSQNGVPLDLPRVDDGQGERPTGLRWDRQIPATTVTGENGKPVAISRRPLDEDALSAVVRLGSQAHINRYWPKSRIERGLPFCFDTEDNPNHRAVHPDGHYYLDLSEADDPDGFARMEAVAERMHRTLVVAKTANWESPIWAYDWMPPVMYHVMTTEAQLSTFRRWGEILKPVIRMIDGIACCGYNAPGTMQSHWYGGAHRTHRWLDEFAPGVQRIMVMKPTLEVEMPPGVEQPAVPSEDWQRQANWAADHGWSIMAWTGYSKLVSGMKGNLSYLRYFIR